MSNKEATVPSLACTCVDCTPSLSVSLLIPRRAPAMLSSFPFLTPPVTFLSGGSQVASTPMPQEYEDKEVRGAPSIISMQSIASGLGGQVWRRASFVLLARTIHWWNGFVLHRCSVFLFPVGLGVYADSYSVQRLRRVKQCVVSRCGVEVQIMRLLQHPTISTQRVMQDTPFASMLIFLLDLRQSASRACSQGS